LVVLQVTMQITMARRFFSPPFYTLTGFLLLSVACCFCSPPASTEITFPEPSAQAVRPVVQLPDMPTGLSFAGEPVPLDAFDVRESLLKELIVNMNFHSNTLQWLLRSGRFFPVIEPILKEQGVPDDFKYLCLIESNLENVVSPAGAAGFWQFMKTTGTQYGLEITSEVDERYHLEKSTRAACDYLKKMKAELGSWTFAAASFNAGKAGINNQLGRQGTFSYYDLLLNEETARYVFRILSAKIILTDPERYGFHVPETMRLKPIPYSTVEVAGKVSGFATFARDHGTNYKLLKMLNPWLRDTFLTNKTGKVYQIRIPEKGFRPVPLSQQQEPRQP